jgi:C4-dicarboxylate transporter DctM subunit
MWEIFWIFPLLLILILIGLPVGIALFATTLAIMLTHGFDITPIAHIMYQTIDSFVLSALPIFMLMANILYQANIGEDLFELMSVFLRRIHGGLAIATILACGFFAAISGSSAATVLTIGIVAIPAMFRRHYNRKLVLGTVGAGGLLGVLIPPSTWMIIYGDLAEVSVGRLFIAGVIPGLLLMVIFAVVSWFYSRSTMESGLVLEEASWEEKRMAIRRAFAALWLPPLILGGIYSGAFTPVESASVGTTYAYIISINRLKRSDYLVILKNTVIMTAALFLVIKTAVVFGSALTLLQIPQKLAASVVQAGLGPIMFIIIMSITYFILGCFVDGVCMLLLTIPIILPILKALQIDLTWFCIIMVVNMEIGCITPPFGVNLFALWTIVKDATLGELLSGILPFFVALVLFLIIIIAFPALSTWLPNFIGF